MLFTKILVTKKCQTSDVNVLFPRLNNTRRRKRNQTAMRIFNRYSKLTHPLSIITTFNPRELLHHSDNNISRFHKCFLLTYAYTRTGTKWDVSARTRFEVVIPTVRFEICSIWTPDIRITMKGIGGCAEQIPFLNVYRGFPVRSTAGR